MKARRFYARRHCRQDVTCGVEELIHASRAAGIQETPEVFPGGRHSVLKTDRANAIKPTVSDRKEEGLRPGNRPMNLGRRLEIG